MFPFRKPGGRRLESGFVGECLKICSSRTELRIHLQVHPENWDDADLYEGGGGGGGADYDNERRVSKRRMTTSVWVNGVCKNVRFPKLFIISLLKIRNHSFSLGSIFIIVLLNFSIQVFWGLFRCKI